MKLDQHSDPNPKQQKGHIQAPTTGQILQLFVPLFAPACSEDEEMLMKDKPSPSCVPQGAAGNRTPQLGTDRAHPYKNPSSGHGLVPMCQRRRGSRLGFRLPTAPAVPLPFCQWLCQPGF